MSAERICAECGATLSSNAPGNRCPKCLFQIGLEPEIDDPERGCPQPQHLPGASRTSPSPGRKGRGEGGPEIPNPKSQIVNPKVRYFGDYELLEEIAHGGMGVVYKARQVSLNRVVAVKMLLFAQFANEDFIKRFRIEAQAAANLDHPNIVAIHEVGEHEGQPYYSMDYVDGQNLADLVRDQTVMTERAARYLKTIADAVHYAHQRGVLHRDLKPANILIDENDQPHVTDFGLAKQLQGDSELTLTGQVLGSPNFAPPEQVAGRHSELGPRSDVYSLGAILYHLLTGRPPFVAETLEQIISLAREKEPVAPRALNPNVPRDLETICLKCLEKEPSRRYATAHDLAEELGRYLRDEPILARAIGQTARFWRWCRRKPTLAASLFLILLLLLIVIIGAPIATYRINRERQRAEGNAVQSHSRLVRQYVANGNRLVESGDPLSALPWFAKALDEEQNDPSRASVHCLRLACTARQCPKLTWIWWPMTMVPYAVFSPDGRHVAAAAGEGARVWDVASGEPVTSPLLHGHPVGRVCFSPDGRWILSAGNDRAQDPAEAEAWNATPRQHFARIWDASTGEPRTPPLLHNGAIRDVAFSPDGRQVVTASNDGRAQRWDATTGQPLGPPLEHGHHVRVAQFSPDGRWILTASTDGTARLWNAESGQLEAILVHAGAVFHAAFAPHGDYIVTTSEDNTVRIWKTATGLPLALRHFDRFVVQATFSSDGQWVVTAGSDGVVLVLDATTLVPVAAPLRQKNPVRSALFSPDGRWVVTASMDRTVRVWDWRSGQAVTPALVHPEPVNHAAFSPDGRQIVSSCLRAVRVWDLSGNEPTVAHQQHPALVDQIVFHPDSRRVVTVSLDGTALFWDATTGRPVDILQTNLVRVRHVTFSADGQQLGIAYANGTARVWDVATGRPASPPLAHRGPVNDIEFHRDGQRVVTASGDGVVRVWEVNSGACRWEWEHPGPVKYAAFVQDGRRVLTLTLDAAEPFVTRQEIDEPDERAGLIAGSAQARMWDVATGLPGSPAYVISSAASQADFTRDGHYVVVNGREPGVWDMVEGERISQFPIRSLLHVHFSHDGSKIVVSDRNDYARLCKLTIAGPELGLFDAHSVEMFPVLRHTRSVRCAVFSPSGRLVATASKDQTARVWDALTGEPITPPLGRRGSGAVNRVAFSPDERWLLTATGDAAVDVWDLGSENRNRPVEDQVQLAELMATRTWDGAGPIASRLSETWEKLRRKYPSDFIASPEQVLVWQRRQVRERGNILAEEHYLKGGRLLESRHWAEASAAFQTAAACGSSQADLYSDIAWLYANGPGEFRSPEQALPLALRAVELSYTNRATLNTLGAVYFRLGQLEKAIATLEQGGLAGPRDEIAKEFFLLALCHHARGDPAKAREIYDQAIRCLESHTAVHGNERLRLEALRAEAAAVAGKPTIR